MSIKKSLVFSGIFWTRYYETLIISCLRKEKTILYKIILLELTIIETELEYVNE